MVDAKQYHQHTLWTCSTAMQTKDGATYTNGYGITTTLQMIDQHFHKINGENTLTPPYISVQMYYPLKSISVWKKLLPCLIVTICSMKTAFLKIAGHS